MNTIKVLVVGAVGSGKSHVLQVINDALKQAYGPHAQICSHELSQERALGSPGAEPMVADTVFVLKEQGEARESSSRVEMALHAHATEELRELGQTLKVLPDGYALESAIASTASLLTESQSKYVFDRLAGQFDALLSEQIRQLVA